MGIEINVQYSNVLVKNKNKNVISARILSGLYRTDRLMRHWSTSNPAGFCRLPGCENQLGTLTHILLHCPALAEGRRNSISHWSSFLVPRPWLFPIVSHYALGGDALLLQFLMDPSTLPMVISSAKEHPELMTSCFYLARTWNFTIHLKREKMRKIWNLKN